MRIERLSGLKLDTEEHQGKWFLAWLGKVNHNTDRGTREVILWFFPLYEKRLKDGLTYDDPLVFGKGRSVARRIGVGNLAYLTIGMVIDKDGYVIDEPLNYSQDWREFKIDDVQSPDSNKYLKNVIEQGKIKSEQSSPSISEKIYADYPFPLFDANDCPCFVFNSGDLTVIIPKFEIARFFLFPSSSKLCKRIFSQNVSDLYWVDDEEKKSISPTKKFIVAKGIKQIEAATLANLAFVNTYKKAADYVVNSIRYAYSKRSTKGESLDAFFNTNFPFEGSCSIYSVGRVVEYDNKKFFLIYELLQTNYELPFSSVAYDYYEDNRSGQNKNDPNLKEKGFVQEKTNPQLHDPLVVNLDIIDAPKKSSQIITLEHKTASINYFNIQPPTVKVNDKLLQEYKSKGKTAIIDKIFDRVSTEEPQTDGEEDIAGVDIIITGDPLIDGKDYLQSFFDLVTQLQIVFNVSYLNINAPTPIRDFRISYLPYKKENTIDISDHLHFCFYNPKEDEKMVRRLSIVELNIEKMYFYMIEIDSTGIENNTLRTVTIYLKDFRKIDTSDYPNIITDFLRYAVTVEWNFSEMTNKGSFSELGLQYIRSNHNLKDEPKKNAYKHIEKIIKIIDDVPTLVPLKLKNYTDSYPI